MKIEEPVRIMFISLGCDTNLVDSETMLGLLDDAGYEFTDDAAQADVIIVNTCCFIGDAKEESINTILEMARMKQEGRCRVLLATGCLAQRYRDEIREEIPELDGVLGTASYDSIVSMVRETLAGHSFERFDSIDRSMDLKPGRIVTTGGHYAYLKIAEGCDKHCTYCVIPSVRGHYRSVPEEQIIAQAEELAAEGVKELILVAQETTLYGTDLYGRKTLPELLRGLCRISGIRWIRLLYCYPEEITPELVSVIKEEPKICHYLDMPIQHSSDQILKRMGRHTDQAQLRAQIAYLREQIPDICLRTTIMTGFPGETQEDHEDLLRFVDECEFDRLGVFTYSREEGTPATEMENQVPEKMKKKRRDDIMRLQQEISARHCADMIGRVLDVIVEGKLTDEDAYAGRTYMDAPDVDGLIFFQTDAELMTGDFVTVKVTGAMEYDLTGELTDEPAE